MKRWDLRSIEVRNLFNPAFCGVVIVRAVAGYEEIEKRGMPFSLVLLMLPLTLHSSSRETFERSSRTYLLKVVSQHPELLVGLAPRVSASLAFTFEALGLLHSYNAVAVTGDGRIVGVEKTVRRRLSGSQETLACQRVARYLGKQMAMIDDRATIYKSLGIRP